MLSHPLLAHHLRTQWPPAQKQQQSLEYCLSWLQNKYSSLLSLGSTDWPEPNSYKSPTGVPRELSCVCFSNMERLASASSSSWACPGTGFLAKLFDCLWVALFHMNEEIKNSIFLAVFEDSHGIRQKLCFFLDQARMPPRQLVCQGQSMNFLLVHLYKKCPPRCQIQPVSTLKWGKIKVTICLFYIITFRRSA